MARLPPEDRKFTHFAKHNAARLDYFLTSDIVSGYVQSATIGLPLHTDHCPIYLTIWGTRSERGPGVWRFPNALCSDKKFYEELEQHIKVISEQHQVGNIGTWLYNNQQLRANEQFIPDKLQSYVSLWGQ